MASCMPSDVVAPDTVHMIVHPRGPYALGATLSCGQTFRFRRAGCVLECVCGDLAIRVEERAEAVDIMFTACPGGIERVKEFLDIDHDVAEAAAESLAFLCRRFPQRASLLQEVFLYSRGTHLLRLPVLETIVGYLLSVQSTVSLVGKRLDTMARLFPANRRVVAGSDLYLFPSLEELRTLSSSSVGDLRLGYRLPWVVDLLARLPDEATLNDLQKISSTKRQEYFRQFAGIGPKVAACIDLFAYGGDDAFPIDVWVDRGLHRVLGMTSAGIRDVRQHPATALGPHCGLFSEYLFRYERDRAAQARIAPLSMESSPLTPRSWDKAER